MPKSSFSNEFLIFRNMLRELRIKRGVTQASLSDALGMPQSFVSKYEMGERRLDFVEVAHICRELDMPLVEFAEYYTGAVQGVQKRTVKTVGGGRR